MRARQINLNNINKKLKHLMAGRSPAARAFLLRISSQVELLDQNIDHFFRENALLLSNSTEDANALSSRRELFQKRYKLITDDLRALGRTLMSVTVSTDHSVLFTRKNDLEDMKQDLTQLGHEVILLSNYVPKFKYSASEKNLYALCTALGGYSLQIGQVILPTMGVIEEEVEVTDSKGTRLEKVLKEMDGICGGMQQEWAHQSAECGTPNYPIGSTMKILQNQDTHRSLIIANYGVDVSQVTFDMLNLSERMTTLEANIPYLMALSDKDGGHAVGLRKHPGHIEIFDPNFGYFFFRNQQSAVTWMTYLLQMYRAENFPCDNILFAGYGLKVASEIPASTFPGAMLMDKSVTHSYSKEGHQLLMKSFKLHVKHIIRNAKPERVTTLVMAAVEATCGYFNCQDEFADAVKVLQALPTTAENAASLQCLIDKLTLAKPAPKANPETVALIHQIEQANRTCRNTIYELASDLREEAVKKAKDRDYVKMSNLQNKIDLISQRQTRLRWANIAPRLLASLDGQLAYTVEEARADIEFHVSDLRDMTQLEPHITLLDNLERAKLNLLKCKVDLLKKHHDYIHSFDRSGNKMDLHIDTMLGLQDQIISDKILAVAQLRSQLLTENNSNINSGKVQECVGHLQQDKNACMGWVADVYSANYTLNPDHVELNKLYHFIDDLRVQLSELYIGRWEQLALTMQDKLDTHLFEIAQATIAAIITPTSRQTITLIDIRFMLNEKLPDFIADHSVFGQDLGRVDTHKLSQWLRSGGVKEDLTHKFVFEVDDSPPAELHRESLSNSLETVADNAMIPFEQHGYIRNDEFVRKLKLEISRIEKTSYGKPKRQLDKIDILNELLFKVDRDYTHKPLSEMINDLKHKGLDNSASYYDIIASHRRTGFLSCFFRLGKPKSQALLDAYCLPVISQKLIN